MWYHGEKVFSLDSYCIIRFHPFISVLIRWTISYLDVCLMKLLHWWIHIEFTVAYDCCCTRITQMTISEKHFSETREREWVKKTEAICVFVLRFDSMKLPTDIFVNYFFCKLCLQNIWDSGSTFQLFPCFSSVCIIHAHCTFQIPHINTKFTKS